MNRRGFEKQTQGPSYFSRFQVKFRRRREGKTNYTKRRKLVVQDKTKFNTPKYRFVVRITNQYVKCQIIWTKLKGDEVICEACSDELPKYGYKVGLKNYSATYLTGFLVGRRLLTQVGLSEKYESVGEVSGAKYLVDPDEEIEGSKPFKCYLDIGLARGTVGAKVFGAMKGGCDAGLYIPHRVKRFPGYKKADNKYDAEKHRERIMGIHVQKNMEMIKEKDEERYKKEFSQYVKNNVNPEDLPKMVQTAIENIKKDPKRVKKEKKKYKFNKYMQHRNPPLNLKVRKQKIAFKKKKLEAKRDYLFSVAPKKVKKVSEEVVSEEEEDEPVAAEVDELEKKEDKKGGKPEIKAKEKKMKKQPKSKR